MIRPPDILPHLAWAEDEIDRSARVRALAIVLLAEFADLTDEEDCWRCLFRNGVRPSEAFALSPDAIREARREGGLRQFTELRIGPLLTPST